MEPVSRQLSATEALRRELSHAHAECVRYKSSYEKELARADNLQREVIAARQGSNSSKQQADKQAREISILRAEKQSAVEAARSAEEYTRKLEAKLTMGSKGQFLVEQNTKLRAALQQLKAEHEAAVGSLEAHKVELQRATREIEVLATALEMRADELHLDGDLKSGLLYEVAHRREESRRMEGEAKTAKDAAAAAEFELRETKIALQRAQADISALSSRVSTLSGELDSERNAAAAAQKRIATLEHERDVSLDYVTQQSTAAAEARLRAEAAERRAAEKEQAAAEAEAARTAAEARIAHIKDVQGITNSALQTERAAVKEVSTRAERAETALTQLKAEAAALRTQVATITTANQELQIALSARSQEVVSLQAQVHALGGEYSDGLCRLQHERIGLESQMTRAQSELTRVQESLRAVQGERDALAAALRDEKSRSAAARGEASMQAEAARRAEEEAASIRRAKDTLQSTLLHELRQLREQLASERAARAVVTVEEKRERARAQREYDSALAQPRRQYGAPTATSAGASASAPGSPGRDSGAAAAAAAAVRAALREQGFDESIADEYEQFASAAAAGGGSGDAADKAKEYASTHAAVEYRSFAAPRSPARHYVELAQTSVPVGRGLGQDKWSGSLRSVSATRGATLNTSATAAADAAGDSAAAPAASASASPPSAPAFRPAGVRNTPLSPPLSPGSAALAAAMEKTRKRLAAAKAGSPAPAPASATASATASV